MPVYHLPIHHNPASQTCPQCNNNEISHIPRSPVHHLTKGRGIGIIGQNNGNIEMSFKHFHEGDHSFPVQVWGIFYDTPVIITVGGTYPDTCQFQLALLLSEKLPDCPGKVFHIIIYILMPDCWNGSFRIYLPFLVNDPQFGESTSNIYSGNYFFHYAIRYLFRQDFKSNKFNVTEWGLLSLITNNI